MPKNNWIILDRAGRIYANRFDDQTSYQKVLEVVGADIAQRGFDDGLPNTLILNGKVVVKNDFFEIASNFQTALSGAFNEARRKVHDRFPMPEPTDL